MNSHIPAPQDDSPKTNPWTDDTLGYRPFSERIFKVVSQITAPNGYVIGLQGSWGSGKSTVLNFIRAYVEKHNEETTTNNDRIHLIDFRPWLVSGHVNLVSEFFKVLSQELASESPTKRKLKVAIRFVRSSTDALASAAAKIGIAMDPTGGIASTATTSIAKNSINKVIDKWLADPSIQATYDTLVALIREHSNRIIVFIDDLDRLDPNEIRDIMSMVKSVGRLPNILYILAYDKNIVWPHLDLDNERSSSPRFAEKIIQQEIDLPKPSRNSLLSMLDREISFLIGQSPESSRWHTIVQNGIFRWIRRPRDVTRLANAVKFSWSALDGEMDPQDLLAMEGIRLFDESAFNWVRDNRDFLFSEGSFFMADDEKLRNFCTRFGDTLPIEKRDYVLRLLGALFPSRAKYINASEAFGSEPYFEIRKRRGIGCEQGYDTYFSLFPSADAIPKSAVDATIQKLDDRNFLSQQIKEWISKKTSNGQSLIGDFFDELAYRFMSNEAIKPTACLIETLLESSERVASVEWNNSGLLNWPPTVHLSSLMHQLLGALGETEAGAQLISAFEACHSPYACADVFVDRAKELGVISNANSTRNAVINMETLEKLGYRLLVLIDSAKKTGRLQEAPVYWDILLAWKYLEGPALPREWIARGIDSDPRFLTKAARGLLSYSMSSGKKSYSMHGTPDLELYEISSLLAACAKHLDGGLYSDDDERMIRALVAGLNRISGH